MERNLADAEQMETFKEEVFCVCLIWLYCPNDVQFTITTTKLRITEKGLYFVDTIFQFVS